MRTRAHRSRSQPAPGGAERRWPIDLGMPILLLLLAGCATETAAPVASIAAQESVAVGDTVILDGTASTGVGPLEYSWSLVGLPAGSTASLLDSEGETTSFVPDVADQYRVRLVVYAGVLASEPTERTISVEACDGSTLTAHLDVVAPDIVTIGSTVLLQGGRTSASDLPPCGGAESIECGWAFAPPANSATSLRSAEICTPTFLPDVPGIYRATLFVTDGSATQSPPVSVSVAVAGCGFYPPQAVAGAAATAVEQGEAILLDGSGSSDPDNDPACGHAQWLAYEWLLVEAPAGSRAFLDEPRLINPALTADLPGAYEIRLLVSDSTGLVSAADSVRVVANAAPGFSPDTDVVTSVRTSSPLTSSGGATPELAITPASTVADGYVSAVDWTRFSTKVESVNAGPGLYVSGTPTHPTVNVLFGSTAGTAAEGNDPRLSDVREPSPGSAYYLQNQASTSQAASFNISGDAAVGGDLRIGGVLDAPHAVEEVQHDDPRLTYQPAAFTCGAGQWCEAASGWGTNRFSAAARYTECTGDVDCSANWVELRLDDNSYRTVLLSHHDWSASRVLTVFLSFDGGASYTFHKTLNTRRDSGVMPSASSVRSLATNLPLGADLRVRVEATRGQMRFEGFGLAKIVMPEDVPRSTGALSPLQVFRYQVRDTGEWNAWTALAYTAFTATKAQDGTRLKIVWTDANRVISPTSNGGVCAWELRVNGASCSPDPLLQFQHDTGSAPSSDKHQARSVTQVCEGVPAGPVDLLVYSRRRDGDEDCDRGYGGGVLAIAEYPASIIVEEIY